MNKKQRQKMSETMKEKWRSGLMYNRKTRTNPRYFPNKRNKDIVLDILL